MNKPDYYIFSVHPDGTSTGPTRLVGIYNHREAKNFFEAHKRKHPLDQVIIRAWDKGAWHLIFDSAKETKTKKDTKTKKQTIYIAMGIDDDTARLIPLCYHQSKQRVGEVGEALAREQRIRFLNIYTCNEADWEAFSSFPDDHPLNSPH